MKDICDKGVLQLLHEKDHGVGVLSHLLQAKAGGRKVFDIRGFHKCC